MGEVVDPSQDLCSPYHVSSSNNSSLNRVYSLITQQERQVFGDQSKTIIVTSKGGYKNNATTYGMGGVNRRGSYGRGYTSKICSHFKFKNQNLHDFAHYSRYTRIFLLKQKYEVVKVLENFVIFVQTQFETTLKIIRSDNGTEFFMTNFFVSKGIIHQTSCVNTPQQNSIVEMKHGHLIDVARVLMIQSYLPKIYWSNSVIHVAHIINMLPTPVLNYSSPHEMLFKTDADFIGFPRVTKGYILLNIQSREIFVSRDVVFYEHLFPYQRVQDTSNETNSPDIDDQILFAEDQYVLSQPSQVILAPYDNVENSSDNNCESQIEISKVDGSHIDQNLNENHDREQSSESDPSVRMSTRIKRPPEYLKDYHCNLNVSSTSLRVKYPLNFVLSYSNLSPSYKSFVMSFSSHVEPNTYSEGMKHDCWRKAIQCEISALESNQTWETAILPKNKVGMGCKWVFKIKYKADGTIERYKAKLVAKGYT